MKKIVVVIILFAALSAFSQAFNGYQYLVIPAKFSFQKQANEYGINALIELYFKQQGFTVVSDKNQTTEMASNPCNAVYVNALKESNLFSTKIVVEIKDCAGQILLTSLKGNSRAKEFDVAYKEAFRMALKSIPDQNYKFNQNNKAELTHKNIPSKENTTTITNNNIITDQDELIVETLSNGYLLINKTSAKIYLKLYNTSSQDVFIATSNEKNGIVIRTSNDIIFEYVASNKILKEILKVKF